jgi:TonB family protein
LARHPATSVVGILGHRVSYLRRRLERIRSGRRFEAMSLHRMTVAASAIAAVALSLLPIAPTPTLMAHPGSAEAHDLEALAEPDLPVVLHFQQAPVEKVFQALQGTSGVTFLVSDELAGKTVDIDTGRVSLTDALVELGHVAKLSYEVVDPYHVQVVPVLTAGSDGVTLPVLIPESKFAPVYPERMRLEKVQGRVVLQAKIDASGNVAAIEVLNSQPEDEEASRLFVESARDAVSGWRYEPATKDGEPVEVWFTIRIDFKLQ